MALFPKDYFTPLASGLDHPEGVTYGPDGLAYAGGEAGQIYRIGLDGALTQIGSTGGFCLGLACDASANVYICDSGHAAVMKMTPDGSCSIYCDRAGDVRFRTPNFPVFDEEGNLFVSDSGGHFQNNGRVYVIRPGGEAELFSAEPSVFANGLCLSPDRRYLYVVESERPGVSRLPILPSLAAGPCEQVLTLPADVVPDGLAFDEAGNLYISCYQPNRIYRLSPQGDLDTIVDDPTGLHLAMTTNLVFAGPDLGLLLIANLGGWHIAQGSIGARGAPLAYPSLAK